MYPGDTSSRKSRLLDFGPVENPPPPPLPKYEPDKECPGWSLRRMKSGLPVDKPFPWPKIGDQPTDDDSPDWRGVIKNKIDVYPLPEAYKFGTYNDPRYFWFDTPDYADPFKKLWYAGRFSLLTGTFIALARAAFMDQASFTLANNLRYTRMIILPTMAMGLCGSAAVIICANLRGKKDDMINYAVGGFVAGSILGRRHYTSWFWSVCVVTPLAMVPKYNAEVNGHIALVPNRRKAKLTLSGLPGTNGIASGDHRLGYRVDYGDPGRQQRRFV